MHYQYVKFIVGILISYNKSRKKSNLLNIELNNPYEIERIISVGKRINYKFDIHDRKPGCIIIPGLALSFCRHTKRIKSIQKK